MVAKNLAGQRFGRMTVIDRCLDHGRKKSSAFWNCLCDCGNVSVVATYKLTSMKSQSCGCLAADKLRALRLKHGLTETPEYLVWMDMHKRCKNPKSKRYYSHGARGIAVCARWSEFQDFINDMGPRPSPKHSIDRIDNNGGYGPENCRWATTYEQAANKRNNRRITAFGETLHLAEWARRVGIKPDTISMRLKRGLSSDRALTEPLGCQIRGRT